MKLKPGQSKVNNHLTYINNDEDRVFLTRRLFPVNLRLMKSSKNYRELIQAACNIVVANLRRDYSDYSSPYGMSGANCGIPFNIIAFFQNKGKKEEKVVVMLNPMICHRTGERIVSKSNCGSIRLAKPIDVERHETVEVQWYDLCGKKHGQVFRREHGSLTIQHEIDHNLGILITDRQPK